ncbi:MAG: hypothetical protein ACYDAQ_17530 [Mycobacteriales bacterium]
MPDFYQADYWVGYVGQDYYTVHAGGPFVPNDLASPDQPSSTGELEIWNDGTAQGCYVSDRSVTYVTVSSIPGPFDIVTATGNRLKIRGANGTTFTYTVGAASQQPGVTTSDHGASG